VQPVASDPRTDAALLELIGDRVETGSPRQTVETTAVDHRATLREGRVADALGARLGRDHLDDGQVEAASELVVALVVGGDGHDRAGAVAHQDVVGDPDRQPLAVHRVDGMGPRENARLLGLC